MNFISVTQRIGFALLSKLSTAVWLYLLCTIVLPLFVHSSPFIPAIEKPDSLRAKPYAIRLNREQDDISCSGTVVSPDGYILTALHCVLTCNIASSFKVPVNLPSGLVYEGAGYIPDLSKNCNFKDLGLADVIAWGTNRFIDSNEILQIGRSNLDDAKKLIQEGYTAPAGRGDFAILKLKERKNMACAKTTRRSPKSGEKVWSYSFPKIDRPELKSKDGEAYFSDGIVTSSVLESSRLKKLPANDPSLKFYSSFFDDSNIFWSNMDSEGGMSGAAVFSEDDRVLGIYVSSLKPRNEYAEGVTKGITILSIIENLEGQLGPEKVNQIFNCP